MMVAAAISRTCNAALAFACCEVASVGQQCELDDSRVDLHRAIGRLRTSGSQRATRPSLPAAQGIVNPQPPIKNLKVGHRAYVERTGRMPGGSATAMSERPVSLRGQQTIDFDGAFRASRDNKN